MSIYKFRNILNALHYTTASAVSVHNNLLPKILKL